MNKFYLKSVKSAVILLFLCVFTAVSASAADSLKPEEIIAKHLDSFGSSQLRSQVKNIMAVGTANFNVLRSPEFTKGKVSSGKSVFISEEGKIYFGIKFDSLDYTLDEIIFDSKTVDAAQIRPGNRSALGNFIISNRYIVSEGLFGGVLSSNWSLINLSARGAKVKNDGKKKINNRQAYVLDYSIKGGTPLNIRLFFDAENFQHLRTEYQQVLTAPMVKNPADSARQVQTVHKLTEEFSNYKQVEGLTLPHSYQINLLIDGKLTHEFEWKFDFSQFVFNQKIDSKTFEIQ